MVFSLDNFSENSVQIFQGYGEYFIMLMSSSNINENMKEACIYEINFGLLLYCIIKIFKLINSKLP